MAQNTQNTQAFIEAEQYSQFILENLHDGLLPDTFTRDVSDFSSGTTLNIKTIGTATIQDVVENQALTYNAIDTDTVTLAITDYIGDAWHITDVLRMDGAQIEQLQASRAKEATRAIQEYVETSFLKVANAAQVAGDQNIINNFAHRKVAEGTGQVVTLNDFRDLKLSFDKANVPQMGRIALVDPVVEATLNGLVGAEAFKNNPMFGGVVNEGFARDHKFVANIFGWDIYTTNFLQSIAAETVDGVAVTGGVANVFMSVIDDHTKPIMRAWRQMPKAEGDRNSKLKRDEFDVTARFGLGAQRTDSLAILLTDATTY